MAPKSTQPAIRVLVRGLAQLLPLLLTGWILYWVWSLLSKAVIQRLDAFLHWTVIQLVSEEGWAASEKLRRAEEVLPSGLRFGLAIFLSLAVVLIVGWACASIWGKSILLFFEHWIQRVPLVSAIYPSAKQITEFAFGGKQRMELERVVAVPYPHTGVYSMGFLTGSRMQKLETSAGRPFMSVFIPTSPMPATGFTVFVPIDEIIPLELSVEEALRTIISGGVLLPEKFQTAPSTSRPDPSRTSPEPIPPCLASPQSSSPP